MVAVIARHHRAAASRWRGLAFNVTFYGWTIALIPIGLALAILAPQLLRPLSRLWAGGALRLLSGLVGLRHKIQGRENLPAGPFMLAVKHQSAWETLALNLMVRDPSFVLKRELTRIPVFGWLLSRIGMIAVDRTGGSTALRTLLAAARQRAAEGRPIVIFPEGTRTSPGQHRRYHPGVAALYASLDIPVVPVALNSGLFWPRRSTRLTRGEITIEFLPVIMPGLSRREFMARLRAAIEETTDRLVEEAYDIPGYHENPGPEGGDGTVCG